IDRSNRATFLEQHGHCLLPRFDRPLVPFSLSLFRHGNTRSGFPPAGSSSSILTWGGRQRFQRMRGSRHAGINTSPSRGLSRRRFTGSKAKSPVYTTGLVNQFGLAANNPCSIELGRRTARTPEGTHVER